MSELPDSFICIVGPMLPNIFSFWKNGYGIRFRAFLLGAIGFELVRIIFCGSSCASSCEFRTVSSSEFLFVLFQYGFPLMCVCFCFLLKVLSYFPVHVHYHWFFLMSSLGSRCRNFNTWSTY